VTRHPGIVVRALSWNLYHGRDRAPDPSLHTERSRYLKITETNETHAQVNRNLLAEFTDVLAADPWTVALLQEAPPRWLRPLCRATGAHGASALTSRNQGAALRALVAELNPDLVASNEGGTNQLLVRPPWRIEEVRRLTLTFLPERRRLIWARLSGPEGVRLTVGNLHASAKPSEDVPGYAGARDTILAADRAVAWSGDAPLVFGGDLNLRPSKEPWAFDTLRERFGLEPPTGPKVVDHVLVRGLDVIEPPRQLPPEWRERPGPGGRAIRLSDHAAVAASLGLR
jgi:endonuclease/exonuclease/phosphatase family metal-dependent hydrolase